MDNGYEGYQKIMDNKRIIEEGWIIKRILD